MREGKRADLFLVEHGYATSRTEARHAIEAGRVRVGGAQIAKPSQFVAEDAEVIYSPAHPYVSRGALKLAAALDLFQFSPADAVCLDIGASTGGFTQLLLERGARRIYAVDVGRGQLHPSLRGEPRIIAIEGCNARELTPEWIAEPVDAVVADVSFISLKLALPPALELAHNAAWLVALVKPQFEVGRANINRGGVVRDASARESALRDIAEWLPSLGWMIEDTMESPILGGSGNHEYLLAARKA
ncbi:MAG TPA: TlyA family RNA methyltransferase [Rhizomicrobium sp.]|nr:TlyA family RNA methyltransferase [Rhizomicrobium sp.]